MASTRTCLLLCAGMLLACGRMALSTSVSVSVSDHAVEGEATPNPIYPLDTVAKLLNTTAGTKGTGSLYKVATADDVNMWVMHVYGTPLEMGYAHGLLLAKLTQKFFDEALPLYYSSIVDQLDLSKLPAWLADKIRTAAQKDFPALMEELLAFVFAKEEKYVAASESGSLDEITGIAEGLCASGQFTYNGGCDVPAIVKKIRNFNMIPELVKMTCSMFGAWGSATPDGNLIQLRSLDFGDTPFSNYTVVVVRHPAAARDGGPSNSFAAVSLPSWTGAVTGFSKHIAISEKVWETYDKPDVQPGHYDGEPVALVLRDILQFSSDRADAISFAQHIKRTWAVFVGVGDSASQQFTAIGYREKDLEVFDPANISTVTHMPVVDDVVYIDKHPQPSHDQVTMPKLLQAYHGHIDARAAINITRVMGSGDMHVAVYDFGARKAYVAVGLTTANGTYGGDHDTAGRAYNRPYVELDMDALLDAPMPSL